MKTGSSRSKTSATSTSSAKKKSGKTASEKQAHTEVPPGENNAEGQEPLGAIMSKGIELAEAGLTLGINLVHKFGGSIQEQVMDKIAKSGGTIFKTASDSAPTHPREEKVTEPTPSPATTESTVKTSCFGGVYNRMPAFPGGDLRVSFSINNDSTATVRQVALSIEKDLAGELTGKSLSKKLLHITPVTIDIAPADFEKFTISATIPVNQQPDHYHGVLLVGGEDTMRIPLLVLITGTSS